MPQVVAEVVVPVPAEVAFAVSQTHGAIRRRWDPFIREQHFIAGATAPGKGVRTFTRARVGPSMISEYTTFHPPRNVGMKMVRGPWFFRQFAGGWQFIPEGEATRAVWRYTWQVLPWTRFAGEPVGRWLLGREIEARIRACRDPEIVAAAMAQAGD